jgi:phosphatidylserine/phosphatidylglycerophosphate/cardiolipin synthase-like enzyme
LVRPKGRGIDVRLIADKTRPCPATNGIGRLAAAGVPIWIDAQVRVAHAKTMVIDQAVTLMGSYNWTRGTAINPENLNLASSPAVAAAYAVHWRDASPCPFNVSGARTGAGRLIARKCASVRAVELSGNPRGTFGEPGNYWSSISTRNTTNP